jgi:hypothetical protein
MRRLAVMAALGAVLVAAPARAAPFTASVHVDPLADAQSPVHDCKMF